MARSPTEESSQALQEITRLEDEIARLHAELKETGATVEKLSAAFERCPDAIYVKDVEGRYLFANPSTAPLLHRDVEEIIGATDLELFDEDVAEEIRDVDQFVLGSSRPFRYEVRRKLESVERVIQTTKWPWFREGRPAGVIGISRDITRRSFDEEAHRLQGAVARALLFSSSLDEAFSALPSAIREAFDARACLRWRSDGEGRFSCIDTALDASGVAGGVAQRCGEAEIRPDDPAKEKLVGTEPFILCIGNDAFPERLEGAEGLDLKTTLGFAVQNRGVEEIIEVLLSERRFHHPELSRNLSATRDLIKGASDWSRS